MKAVFMQIVQSIALGALIPGLLFSTVKSPERVAHSQTVPTAQEEIEVTVPKEEQEQIVAESVEVTIPVLKSNGQVEQMALEDYVCRVVLGEMPASFQNEALKAQAVAARTYTLRCVTGGSKHEQNAICTSYQCCQAFCEPEAYIKNGGSFCNVEKVFDAVRATAGEVVYYNNKLIMATYFSSAGNTTEDAKAVWGNAFPYLTAVRSPEGDNVYNGQNVTFTAQEFQKKLGFNLKGKPSEWFEEVTYTAGGGVDQVRIGGTLYKGTKIRSLLGLRSTDFTISTTETSVTFTTNGYGHRVGMSQYGAQAMAVEGSDYRDILLHYYTGTNLGQYHPV